MPVRQAPTGADSRSRTVDADTTTESLVEAVPEFMIGSAHVKQMEGSELAFLLLLLPHWNNELAVEI